MPLDHTGYVFIVVVVLGHIDAADEEVEVGYKLQQQTYRSFTAVEKRLAYFFRDQCFGLLWGEERLASPRTDRAQGIVSHFDYAESAGLDRSIE